MRHRNRSLRHEQQRNRVKLRGDISRKVQRVVLADAGISIDETPINPFGSNVPVEPKLGRTLVGFVRRLFRRKV